MAVIDIANKFISDNNGKSLEAEIPLTKGKFALVDKKDFAYLNQWKWRYHKNGYAVRTSRKGLIRMHRVVNKTPLGFFTDHINHNKLDNRRKNLRTVTKSQNQMNVGLQANNTSGYKGVYWHKQSKKWQAKIEVNQKQINLGCYSRKSLAILARKCAEKVYFGKYSYDYV